MENHELKFKELQEKRKRIDEHFTQTTNKIQSIIDDSIRVAEIAKNAKWTIDKLETEFEKQTELTKTDIKFLFFATALQTVRWILMPPMQPQPLGEKINPDKRFDHNDKRITDAIKDKNKNFKNEHKEWEVIKSDKCYKTWRDIVFNGCPYDITKGSPAVGINLGGGYHRYKTLGHDPVLGWFFGTFNFITDTLTLNNTVSYRIKNKIITSETLMLPQLILEVHDSLDEDIHRLPAAVFAQGVHLSSDKYTKCGLPVPMLGKFSEKIAGTLYRSQYDSLCFEKDLRKIGKNIGNIGLSFSIARMIDMIIGLIHGWFYKESIDGKRDIYEVRTRKILLYSNCIASSSNILYTAICTAFGDKTAVNKLDIGGFINTICRLLTDLDFIQKIKEEFVFGNFKDKILNEH